MIAESGPSGRRVLYDGTEVVDLSPKAVDLLTLLVEHNGDLVTREQIRSTLWGDQFVEDANLTRHVSLVRTCLRDHLGDDEYLIRVPKRGYQLNLTVEVEAAPEPVVLETPSALASPVFVLPISIDTVETVPPPQPAAPPVAIPLPVRFQRTTIFVSATIGALAATLAVLLFLVHRPTQSPAVAAATQPAEVIDPTPTTPAPPSAAPIKSIAILPPVITGKDAKATAALSETIRMVASVSAINGGADVISSSQIADATRELSLPKAIDPALATALAKRLHTDLILTTEGTTDVKGAQLTLNLLNPADNKILATRQLDLTPANLREALPKTVADLLTSASITIDPNATNAEGLPPDAKSLESLARADALYQSGQYRQSLAIALPLAAHNPSSPYTHLLVANIYDATGESVRAASAARSTLDTSGALNGLARIAVQARASTIVTSWQAAVAAYVRLHKALPNNVDYALALADDYDWVLMPRSSADTLRSVQDSGDPRVDGLSADIATRHSNWKALLAYGQAELAHARAIAAPTLISDANTHICLAQARLNSPDEALASCATALKLAQRLHDDKAILKAMDAQNKAQTAAGEEALVPTAHARLEIAEKSGDQTAIYKTLMVIGLAAGREKDLKTAGEYIHKADDLAVAMGNLKFQADGKTKLAWLGSTSHDPEMMYEYGTQALALNRSIKYQYGVSKSLETIGQAYNERGDYDNAVDFYKQAVNVARADHQDETVYDNIHHLVSLNKKTGHLDLAAYWQAELDKLPEAITLHKKPGTSSTGNLAKK